MGKNLKNSPKAPESAKDINLTKPAEAALGNIFDQFFENFSLPPPPDRQEFLQAISKTALVENQSELLLEFISDRCGARTPTEFEKKIPAVSLKQMNAFALVLQLSPLFSTSLKKAFEKEYERAKKIAAGDFLASGDELRDLAESSQDSYDFEWERIQDAEKLLKKDRRYFTDHFSGKNYARDLIERAQQFKPNKKTREWVNVAAIRGISHYLCRQVDSLLKAQNRNASSRPRKIKREEIYEAIRAFVSDTMRITSGFDQDIEKKFIKNQIVNTLPRSLKNSYKFLPEILQPKK